MTKRMISVPVGTPALLSYKGTSAKVVFNDRRSVNLDGTSVTVLIDRLTELQEELSQNYTRLYIESEQDCGCDHDCRCSPSYYIWGTREETDLEYNFRRQEKDRHAREKLERDRKAYEELKKRFGE